MLAGQQPLGASADDQILPFLLHFEEVRAGHGYGESIRTVTIYLHAMLSCVNNTATKKNETLVRYMAEAGKAWMACGEKSDAAGLDDRIVLTGDAMQTISRAIRVFLMVMPQLKLYVWTGAILRAAELWQQRVDSVQRAC